MSNIIETVAEILKRAGCHYELNDDGSLVRTRVSGRNGEWHFQAVVLPDAIMMLSTLPFSIPKSKRSACAELLTRINCRSKFSVFTVDFDDGQLCSRISFLRNGETMSSEQLEPPVNGISANMDLFIPAIMSVVYAGIPPAEALERAIGDGQLAAAVGNDDEQSRKGELPSWRN